MTKKMYFKNSSAEKKKKKGCHGKSRLPMELLESRIIFVGGRRTKRITALNSRERQSQQLLLGCLPAGSQEREGIRCKVKVIVLFPNTFRTT